ncbi:FAD-dependent monooxygenase [Streptomyces sp. TRM68367]|uniref:FAD-dependent monooxygenase n=1 Tax=Streptomyces sp. TRM68367 TaxID=2758415 RepID=UPI00165A3BC7|nr:FAD-dependent monooxygenase [Streptomyces sp. TRM68367]
MAGAGGPGWIRGDLRTGRARQPGAAAAAAPATARRSAAAVRHRRQGHPVLLPAVPLTGGDREGARRASAAPGRHPGDRAARHVVGCDGAHSTVRAQAGTGFRGPEHRTPR